MLYLTKWFTKRYTISHITICLFQKHRLSLVTQLENSSVVNTTLDLLQWLMGPNTGGSSSVGVGVSKAIKTALTELHTSDKTVENTDQLMVSFVLWCLDCFIVIILLNGSYQLLPWREKWNKRLARMIAKMLYKALNDLLYFWKVS